MMPRLVALLVAAAAGTLAHGAEHLFLEPISNDTSLPEKALLYMHGGAVENSYYLETARAIQQAATSMRLWVILPQTFMSLCILSCPSVGFCWPLKRSVDAALQKAVDAGWNRGDDSQNLFIAGHSLGGICAEQLLTAYDKVDDHPYAGIIYHASTAGDVGYSFDAIPIPLMVQNGEVDGLSTGTVGSVQLWERHLAAVDSLGFDTAVRDKLVVMISGVNHSNWCPGFDVPKDIMADVDQATALSAIGSSTAAFLHLHTPEVAQSIRDSALQLLQDERAWTSSLFSPYLRAIEMESSEIVGDSFSVAVQKELSSELHDYMGADKSRSSLGDFQDCVPDVFGTASFQTCSYAKVKGEEMLVKINLVGQETARCSQANQLAEAIALELAPNATRARYLAKGRKWCVPDEIDLARAITTGIEVTEDDDCMTIRSPGSLASGEQLHCALATPAKALAWMYTDSLRPEPLEEADNTMQNILSFLGVLLCCVCCCACCFRARLREACAKKEGGDDGEISLVEA